MKTKTKVVIGKMQHRNRSVLALQKYLNNRTVSSNGGSFSVS